MSAFPYHSASLNKAPAKAPMETNATYEETMYSNICNDFWNQTIVNKLGN